MNGFVASPEPPGVACAFPPNRSSALERCDRVDPRHYAATRNHLHGAVSGLSPYITHGLITIPEVLERTSSRHALCWQDKFVFELGWREYFHHAWGHLGERIWGPARPLPAPATAYHASLPEDVTRAATGVEVVDQSIIQLYRSGYLHNHQRMWLASYLVHLRKIDWRAGARWMYGHLLDGDLASNTLSWQWVAGSWTGKPYLFNAENVAKYSPRGWPGARNAGTAIDRSYAELERVAASAFDVGPERSRSSLASDVEPALFSLPPPESDLRLADEADMAGARWLVHPWSLHVPEGSPEQAVGLIVTEFHTAYPWSAMRWHWVLVAMTQASRAVLIGTRDELLARLAPHATRLHAIETLNPFYRDVIASLGQRTPPPRAFPDPQRLHRSFTSFWHAISKGSFPL
ncbi:MAG: FAD-binding domain-containing protein [Casimicrobiaceae bacterium]